MKFLHDYQFLAKWALTIFLLCIVFYVTGFYLGIQKGRRDCEAEHKAQVFSSKKTLEKHENEVKKIKSEPIDSVAIRFHQNF